MEVGVGVGVASVDKGDWKALEGSGGVGGSGGGDGFGDVV